MAKEHWFLLSDDVFRESLARARDGEDVEMLLVEYWSRSEHFTDGEDPIVSDGAEIMTWSLEP